MALELVFESPRTLGKLRSGPLGKLQDGFCSWLQKCGFSRATICGHLSHLSHFNRYLGERNVVDRQTLSTEVIDKFLKQYSSQALISGRSEDHVRRVRRSTNRFIQHLRQLSLFDPLVKQSIYQPLLDGYIEWMRHDRHAGAGTIELRCHSLIHFLEWLGPKATSQGLSGLTSDTVEHFFLFCAQKMGRSGRRSMQAALRTFFRFCLHQSYIIWPLDRAVPTLRTYKLATVPRGLADEQAKKVLQCIDRNNKAGRRDYAICQLLYTYGVRGAQVRALRLEDIDWVKNEILFRASKHGKDTLLPLTEMVGESLLDYLQNARPSYAYPEVFLTTRAPYHPLLRSSTLSALIAYHIHAAGITMDSKGAHVFRHGFATRMLQKGHSLKEVADVLGHRHLGTTFIYAKVDFNALKQVGLPWPQEVQS